MDLASIIWKKKIDLRPTMYLTLFAIRVATEEQDAKQPNEERETIIREKGRGTSTKTFRSNLHL